MITTSEIILLELAALPLWKVFKYKNTIALRDVTNSQLLNNANCTLAEHLLMLKKSFINARTSENKLRLHSETLTLPASHKNQITKEKKANDNEYRIKNNSQKRTSDIKQRLNNSNSYIKRKTRQVAIRAGIKLIQKSKEAQPCKLGQGICIRLSAKSQKVHNNCCPLQHKFLLEDGICHHLK